MIKDSFNRSLDFNAKLKYFTACSLLIWYILQDSIGKFFAILNNRDVVSLGSDFSPAGLFWTDGFLWNMVKLVVVCGLAFLFGVAYSYMARKIRASDAVSISMINAIVGTFGYILVALLFIAIFRSDILHDSIVSMREFISQDGFYMLLVTLQLTGAGVMTFIGINVGQKLIEKLEEDDKGKLLGVKWYHYIWLSPAINVYIQSFLYLAYMTIAAVGVFISGFHWSDILGGNTSDDESNSINTLVWGFALIYFIAVVIFYLLKIQRGILAGKIKMHPVFKVLISIGVTLIIPVLLIIFTAIGDSN